MPKLMSDEMKDNDVDSDLTMVVQPLPEPSPVPRWQTWTTPKRLFNYISPKLLIAAIVYIAIKYYWQMQNRNDVRVKLTDYEFCFHLKEAWDVVRMIDTAQESSLDIKVRNLILTMKDDLNYAETCSGLGVEMSDV